jgi:hypothetical protein
MARVGAQRHMKKKLYYRNFDICLITAAEPAFETLCISDTLQITKHVKEHIPVTTQEMLTSCHLHQS